VVIPNGDHGAGVVWPVQGKNSAIVARRMEGWGLYHLGSWGGVGRRRPGAAGAMMPDPVTESSRIGLEDHSDGNGPWLKVTQGAGGTLNKRVAAVDGGVLAQ